jgi:type I restriction enzyme, S subunit
MATETTTKIGWARHKIKEFGLVSTGTTPSTKNLNYYGGPYKLISPSDLTDSKYIFTAHKFITQQGLNVARTLPKNAVLVGCIGNVGKIGITTDEISAFNQQINAIVCNTNYNADFVYYLLRYQKPLLESKAAKVTLPILNKNNFENIEFEVPDLPEQKSIARVLTMVQQAIAGQRELITKLKELKRGMMQHLFTHGTKGEKTKTTELGDMPESWTVVELRSLVPDIEYGVSQAIPKTKPEHGYKIVSTADITKSGELLYEQLRYIDVKDSQAERLRLKNGDVLFNWRNSLDHIGKSAIYDHNGEYVIFASFVLRLRCDERKSHNRFIRDLMNFYREQGTFSKLARRAVNQANYNRNEIYVLQIPAPTYDEQVAIADVIKSIDKKIEATQGKLAEYQSLFKTLLHELMSGERRIE